MNEIIPHLYISNWIDSNNISLLEKNNIKAVITLETMLKPDFIVDYYKRNKIDFLYIHLQDHSSANISQYFDNTYDFIKKHINNGENVLVHCYAGISRSACIILNYLVRHFIESRESPQTICMKCLVNDNIKYMQSKRSIINPNRGFIAQVNNYYVKRT